MDKINIAELLKDKPKGTKLYSPACGEVVLEVVLSNLIQTSCYDSKGIHHTLLFNEFGQELAFDEGEVCLFPSKRQRDWSKYDVKEYEFEPFQKVLVRDRKEEKWYPDFFSQKRDNLSFPYETITRRLPKYCIPYNENTKHLLGTTDEWKGGEE